MAHTASYTASQNTSAAATMHVAFTARTVLPCTPQLLQGLQKKGVAPEQMARKGAAISSQQERLLLLLNLLNAGGSLVLPCWLVLRNQVSEEKEGIVVLLTLVFLFSPW
jgi:hypothetical protein